MKGMKEKLIYGIIGLVAGVILGKFLNSRFENMNFHWIMPVLGLMMGWDYGKRLTEPEEEYEYEDDEEENDEDNK